MKTSKYELLHLFLILIPVVMGFYYWDLLPEQMATHFGIDGKADDYMDKKFALMLSPVFNIFLYILLKFIPRIDPKKNFDKFGKAYDAIRLGMTGFMSMIGALLIFIGLGNEIAIERIVPLSVLLLFTVIGNLMSKTKPNYFVGIRTPWTLESSEVWKKTHRLAAKLWTYGSVLSMPIVLLIDKELSFYYFMSFVAIISLVPMIYSYVYFKRETNKG